MAKFQETDSAKKADPVDDDNTGADDGWESQSDEDEQDELKKFTMKKKAEHSKESELDVAGGELEGLKETAELYKSNIFKLEVSIAPF
jgi:U3 small nucleolar RNA-associated protein 22